MGICEVIAGSLEAILLGFVIITPLLAWVVCSFARPIGLWLGVMDIPDSRRKVHPTDTPLVGGLAVICPLGALLIFSAFTTKYAPLYGYIAVAIGACFLLGLQDDRKNIRPVARLILSTIFAGLMFWAVPALQVEFFNFSFINYAVFLGGLAPLFSVLCLVGLQNAINMADGKNGIVIGLSIFWVVDISLFAPSHMYPVLIALGISLLVVFWFNLRGALFLGDSGTYALSYLFGLLAIYVYEVGFVQLPADLVALWFLIPVVDCLRLVVSRIVGGVSPFASDQNHLHHIIYRQLPWSKGLVVYFIVAGCPGLFASLWPPWTPLWCIVALTLYGVILVWPPSTPRQSQKYAE